MILGFLSLFALSLFLMALDLPSGTPPSARKAHLSLGGGVDKSLS